MVGSKVVLFNVLMMTVFLAGTVNGAVFRWVDENGQVHFSDRTNLPAEAMAKSVRIHPNVVRTVNDPAPVQTVPARKRHPVRRDTGVRRDAPKAQTVPVRQLKCQNAIKQLEHVRSIMRAGYKASRQAQLHGMELKAMAARHRYCD